MAPLAREWVAMLERSDTPGEPDLPLGPTVTRRCFARGLPEVPGSSWLDPDKSRACPGSVHERSGSLRPARSRKRHSTGSLLIGIPTLIEIRRENKLHMCGCKKVPSRGRTITPHLGEHPTLNLAGLDRHQHVAD